MKVCPFCIQPPKNSTKLCDKLLIVRILTEYSGPSHHSRIPVFIIRDSYKGRKLPPPKWHHLTKEAKKHRRILRKCPTCQDKLNHMLIAWTQIAPCSGLFPMTGNRGLSLDTEWCHQWNSLLKPKKFVYCNGDCMFFNSVPE